MLSRALDVRREFLAHRIRRVPRYGVDPGRTDSIVYYVAPDLDRPSGGVRVIYRHVDLLNDMGVPAAVMHRARGFACSWFEHRTRVVAGGDIRLGPRDVLVVPEWFGPDLGHIAEGPRVVIFNQRAYDTYDHVHYDGTRPGAPYADLPRLLGMLTVSRDNQELLSYAFPGVPVSLVRNAIDPAVFHPGPPRARRRRQIAVVPTRRHAELEQLRHILRARGVFERWTLTPILGEPEHVVAARLRESALFLSLSDREGFGLPPAEAMASGCYVVGYTGLAGREFFSADYSLPVPDGDLLALARAVEHACDRHETDPAAVAELGLKAAAAITQRYHENGLRDDLATFYGPLVG
jgi:glycosyltransferase involved in cell wall biosynthesis